MRKRILTTLALTSLLTAGTVAQRHTDLLDRSVVAVDADTVVYVSWRMFGEEYYDVAWNVYRDGVKLNEMPLNVSNFVDEGGTKTSTYTVKAVVRGVEEETGSAPAAVWENNWLEIPVSQGHGDLTSVYIPNDACCADLDGDGQVEILLKYDNRSDALGSDGKYYRPEGYNGEYALMEALKLDGKRLWWIDLGPNMADFQNNEQNIVAFDWDEDGKAEAVLRASEGTKIHYADGRVYTFNTTLAKSGVGVADDFVNYRPSSSVDQWFIHDGSEFLVYLDGETGEVLDAIDYPNKRLEDGETDLNKAWGDGYGHRSTKHFFGAPFLDGKKPSIFLARGIYTRHKMTALDVDPATHKLTIRWQWNCNENRGDSSDDWFGNGYHNFGIADVDWDGRDEIVYGSMVIDDNGKGLNTTGLGHGDAQHCSDFDPYTHGQEIFAALEDHPGNNFRDATTGKIYYRYVAGDDDGRAMMGNFSNSVLGAQGVSSRDPNVIGAVAKGPVASMNKSNITQNFRIYWDGDLLEETFDYTNGKNTAGGVWKYGVGLIATMEGSLTNNDTKGTPSYQGDILGDWREEIIMRTKDNNIRIYTTTAPTPWRNYTLWHDHQYRQAMVWQMCGYNQPPHVSYFLGNLEGMTVAPPPLTTTGRTVLAKNGELTSANNDQHVLIAETTDNEVTVSGTVAPYLLTVNAPTWVQGHDDNNNITTEYFTTTLKGEGELTGNMRFVKQGDGALKIDTAVKLNYAGETNIWAGTVDYEGEIPNSNIWINRFSTLNFAGKAGKNISLEYDAKLNAGGANVVDTIEIADTLSLNYGAVLSIDILAADAMDCVSAKVLKLSSFKGAAAGLEYASPIVRVNMNTNTGVLPGGKYALGTFESVDGDVNSIVVEGSVFQKLSVSYEDGKLYLNVPYTRPVAKIKWIGDESSIWENSNMEGNLNFELVATGEKTYFVPGDTVIFNDDAKNYKVEVEGTVYPSLVSFENSASGYTLGGGSITGGSIVKDGTAKLTISSMVNTFTGGTTIKGGAINVSNLAYDSGVENGALGNIVSPITLDGGTLETNGAINCSNQIVIGKNSGYLNVQSSMRLTKSVLDDDMNGWYKLGSGTLNLAAVRSSGVLHAVAGTVQAAESSNGYQTTPTTIYFEGGVVKDANNSYTYTTNTTNFVVEEGKSGVLHVDGRCNYTGSLTGSGTLTIYPTFVRSYLNGDWSAFKGTVSVMSGNNIDFVNANGMPNARLVLAGTAHSFEEGGSRQLTNYKLGSLTGAGTYNLNNSCTLELGSDNTDFSFSGRLYAGSFRKVGSGVFTISNPQSDLSGESSVESGVLYLQTINTTTDDYLNKQTLTINGDGVLAGNAILQEVKVNGSGVVRPGKYPTTSYYGEMSFNRLEMQAGTTLELYIRNASAKALENKTSNSSVTVSKVLTLRGNIVIGMSENYKPKAGDTFQFWTCQLLNTSDNTKVTLPELPVGLAWDSSELLTENGVLKVVSTGESDALPVIGFSEEVESVVYDLSGRKVATFKGLRKNVEATVAQNVLRSGLYVVSMKSATEVESIVVRVKK